MRTPKKDQRVVVVTGATGGVGRATARAFAERGDRVALIARGEEGLAAAATEVRDAGARTLAVPVDVVDSDAVEAAASRIEDELGPIDVWVNNAFTSVFARFLEIEPAEFRRITEVNYLGFVHGTRAALARMRARDHGAIVQVGSALAYRGIPLQSAYCASKHAIQGLHDSLRCELLHDRSNVHVTMVQMPAMNTPQFDWLRNKMSKPAQPVPPIYQPEIAAKAVVYAADHPRRREYWVGASTVATLIGNALAPGLLDRYLARTGFSAQQSDRADPHAGAGNLTQPLDGAGGRDYTAHGSFDRSAIRHSEQVWASQHHRLLAAILGACGLATVWTMRRRGRP